MAMQNPNCYGSHPGEEPSSSNLIINYLPQSLSDQDFHDLFAQVGAIKTCKVVRNKQTGYSYGFGFVDYHDPGDANKAIEQYNGHRLENKTLKVALAKPADGDHSKNANVYIRGVPKTFDPKELEGIFEQFGKLVQFRVLRDENYGINKGVAFALYDESDNAERAIREMNGQSLAGSMEPLQVKLADDQLKLRKQRQLNTFQGGMMGGGRGGGPMFGRPPYPGGFSRPNHRFNPMTKGPSYDYNSQQQPQGPQSNGYVLYAYNIGLDTDDNSLYDLFSQYGVVEKATAMKDKMTGRGRGFGFITMPNYDEATWAIENLTGFHYAGKPLQVSFKSPKAQPWQTGGMGSMGGMGMGGMGGMGMGGMGGMGGGGPMGDASAMTGDMAGPPQASSNFFYPS